MHPRPLAGGLPSWREWLALGMRKIGHDLSAAILTLEVWGQRSRERRMLLAMDARMRRDIGISDADVWREARKPFWQP